MRAVHPEVRFRKYHKVGNPSDCWVWSGARMKSGYGILSVYGETVRVHRLSWEIHRGPIPRGLWVLHHCDNKPCVNPSHLYLGDHRDNMSDVAARGRRKGINMMEQNGRAKLCQDDIPRIWELRKTGLSCAKIAREFKVDPTTIWMVVTEKTWARALDDA